MTTKTTTPTLTDDQLEACELRDTIIEFAAGHGWTAEKVGVNKAFAFVRLYREIGDPEINATTEALQAFYAVDESREDKFMYTIGSFSHSEPRERVRAILETVHAAPTPTTPEPPRRPRGRPKKAATTKTAPAPVPPTGAAHQAPTTPSAAHKAPTTSVPPTSDTGDSAAHTAVDVAHTGAGTQVPPESTGRGMGAKKHRDQRAKLSAAQRKDLAQAAKAHHDDAARGGANQAVASQSETYEGTADIALNDPKRSSYSSYTSTELVSMAEGKELVWENGFSGRLQYVDVTPNNEAKKWPCSITPSDMETVETGDDPRMLHFIEHHGGFRSVAIARLKDIR